MSVRVCAKCKGPVTIEGNQYVCALCGEIYGNVEASVNYNTFFENASLEKLQRISRKIADMVVSYGTLYLIAPLSNGQFYTRFIPGPGFSSAYRGQCAAENWYNVKKIYPEGEYTVAISHDGTLQPTLVEVEKLFARIKASGFSDMRMKDIIKISYEHHFTEWGGGTIEDSFVGLDINGKVVIYNPYEAFDLNADDEEDREDCVSMLKQIQAWPAVEKLTNIGSVLIGIAKEGTVYATSSYTSEKRDALLATLSQWTNIDSIVEGNLHQSGFYAGLRKDGTLITYSEDHYTDSYMRKVAEDLSGIVQIAFLPCGIKGSKRFATLTSRGDLILNQKVIDHNVISILKNGYVRADGSIYEYDEDKDKYKVVEGVKLFSSVETIEEEYAESATAVLLFKKNLEDEKIRISNELQSKRNEIAPLQKQYDSLGLFKAKEKKALRPSIDAISEVISTLKAELENIDEKLFSLPNGEAAWKHFDLPKYGSYSVSEISAAAYNAVSYKKPGTSVIGSAAVGAVIAGPAGAIVGAIYAADKNRKK